MTKEKIDDKLSFDVQLVEIADLMIERMNKKWDAVLICDGLEGGGKTTITTQFCYTVSKKTGRKFDVNNIFFFVKDAIEFAGKTSQQIILIDEAALDLLSSEHWNPMQNLLIKLLMVGRKKNHLIIINVPKFYRLRAAIIERSIGLLHVYSPDMISRGPFTYYKYDLKESLFEKFQKRKNANGIYRTYSFHGTFNKTFEELIDAEEYEAKKDLAIEELTKEKENKKENSLQKKLIFAFIKMGRLLGWSQHRMSEESGISRNTIKDWSLEFDKNFKNQKSEKAVVAPIILYKSLKSSEKSEVSGVKQ